MTKRNGGQEQRTGTAKTRSAAERSGAEEALRLIVEGTSSAVGEQFFLILVKHLAIALRTRFAFIAELADPEGERVRLLALWTGTHHGETFEYATERTPCEHVVGKKLAIFPAGVQKLFPEDRWLREAGIESYLAIPLFDSSGNPLGHLGVMHDQKMPESTQAEDMLRIFAARAGGELERKQAEEALRQARDELELRVDERTAELRKVNQRLRREMLRENEVRALVENSPDIILRFDTKLRHVYANQAIERVTGLSPQAVIGKTHAELGVPAAVAAFWQESLAKVFRSGEEDVVGFEFPTSDGTTYFESRVVPEFGRGGEVESVLVLARDITDRKRAEAGLERARVALELRVDDRTAELRKVNQRLRTEMEERKRAEEALRESEVVLRATLEATADGILVVDKNGQVVHANARFAEMWHVPKELLDAGDAKKLRRAVAGQLEDPGAFLSGLRELYETPQESFDALSFRDGRVLERLSRPLIRQGKVAGRVWSFRDVTERNQLEAALIARANQQAAVAGLGQRALTGLDLPALLDETVDLLAQVLNVEYCKVLQLLPGGSALLLQSGVGWKEGYVGHATVGAEAESQAGYTLVCDEPVVVEDLSKETRFGATPLLAEHGVVSGMSVIIRGPDGPYGVLGAHTTRRRTFSEEDIHFLQAVANVLGEAIERTRADEARQRSRETLEGDVDREMQQDNPYRLTFREFTVLHLVADGRADKEIASELVISPLTVHKHMQNILGKMHATSRTQAGVRALREGWLD